MLSKGKSLFSVGMVTRRMDCKGMRSVEEEILCNELVEKEEGVLGVMGECGV